MPDLLPHIEIFLKASEHWVSKDRLFEERHFQLHLGELFGEAAHAVALRTAWPELAEEMEEKPEQVCGKFGLARHNMILKEAGGGEQNFPIVRCRPIGREEEVSLRALKSAFFQRLVAVTLKFTGIRAELGHVKNWLSSQGVVEMYPVLLGSSMP